MKGRKREVKVSPAPPRPLPIHIASRCTIHYPQVELDASFVGLPMSTHKVCCSLVIPPPLELMSLFLCPDMLPCFTPFSDVIVNTDAIFSLSLRNRYKTCDCDIALSNLNLHLRLCTSSNSTTVIPDS
jgi:hypothetical protein